MKNDINYELWNYGQIKQQHNSKKTSINSTQMPKSIRLLDGMFLKGQKWADIGGGRFDNVKEHLSHKDVELLIYDPFNRNAQYNEQTVLNIANGKCDGVMVNNVLNVIEEKNNRKQVIEQAYNAVKEGSLAFFLVYEGDKSGLSKITHTGENSSFQLHQPTKFYLEEIKEVFGDNVVVSKGMIIAKKECQLTNSYESLLKRAKSCGVPNRSTKFGVGKQMGTALYIHKDYDNVLPNSEYKNAINKLTENAPTFKFNIIKFDSKENSFSFINSPDFDTSDEPIILDVIRIANDGTMKYFKPKTDPQIYHHKWNFVKNDYSGFDVKKSIERSIQWKTQLGTNKEVSSRIGTKSYWENTIKNFKLSL